MEKFVKTISKNGCSICNSVHLYTTGLIMLCIYLLAGSIAYATSYDTTGPLEIIHCAFSSGETTWALAMEFDPSKKIDQQSNFSVLKLNQSNSFTQYALAIPVGPPVTPYRAKNQVSFFKLINNRYLYIGTKMLDGTIYFVKFDTYHPKSKHHSMKLRLKGDRSASNILVTSKGRLRFVGSESGLPFIVAMDSDSNKMFEKKGLGLPQHIGTLKFSIMLDNDSILLVFHTYKGDEAGTSLLVTVNSEGSVKASKRLQGLVVEARPTDKGGSIILISHDQNGKDMEEEAIDEHLEMISHFPLPSYLKLIDAAGQLLSVGNATLLSILPDRLPGSSSLVTMDAYSRKGIRKFGTINNPKPGKLRAYNISARIVNHTLKVGTAVISISKSNKGQKAYFIHTFPVH